MLTLTRCQMGGNGMTVKHLPSTRLGQSPDVSVVEAMEIAWVDIEAGRITVVDERRQFVSVDVPEGFFRRSIPACGDFLVRYSDGYVSHASVGSKLMTRHAARLAARKRIGAAA
ncbi:hypothetical protein SMD10_20155 [Consotaella sp. CSK11QG-6]